MNSSRLAFISLQLVLLGCASAPPRGVHLQHLPDVPHGYANVYFMREPAEFGHRIWPAVLLNGQRAAPLPNGSFSVVAVRPGSYTVTMEKQQLFSWRWTGRISINVQADRSYFLRLELKHGIVTSDVSLGDHYDEVIYFDVSAGQSWSEVDQELALAELQELLYVEPFRTKLP